MLLICQTRINVPLLPGYLKLGTPIERDFEDINEILVEIIQRRII